jgi:SP family myo-inositol transporter-like MFS transporter 13
LLGTVFSTLIAGFMADLIGRKWLMTFCGLLFVISIPVIALSHSYDMLISGRLLQGISGGFIGVVIPLYLAECLGASSRGKGTGIFQWMLTLGIAAAAVIGLYFSHRVDQVAATGTPEQIFAFKDAAWRGIFWVSLPPGILFVIGSFMVAESPRWLYKRGQREAARAALLRSRTAEQADFELQEMEEISAHEKKKAAAGVVRESLLRRKYLIPFGLACLILACNQATGVNSVIGYNPTILYSAGLSDVQAHSGYVILTFVNFFTTIGAVVLVDRKGRKFLLSLGTAGIIVSLVCVGLIFKQNEAQRVDCAAAVQSLVTSNQTASIAFNETTAASLLGSAGASAAMNGHSKSLTIIYSYGGFVAASTVVRSDDISAKPIELKRDDVLPDTAVAAFFKNPFINLDSARQAPLKIEHALISPVPSVQNGWLTAICIYAFMAFFAIGPGVCVWLALSELMPTRIRSNGMSFALLINQVVSTTIAAIFLPTVGQYGYSTMFFCFAGCTVVYFLTAFFLLPETKGKTLEEIEVQFEGKKG